MEETRKAELVKRFTTVYPKVFPLVKTCFEQFSIPPGRWFDSNRNNNSPTRFDISRIMMDYANTRAWSESAAYERLV
jgi:hypothetical protein